MSSAFRAGRDEGAAGAIPSGCAVRRGHGKIFYFRPGDQEYPVHHHEGVRRVISDAVQWATTDRPERVLPTLLRYDTEDFCSGRAYTVPIRDHGDSRAVEDPE